MAPPLVRAASRAPRRATEAAVDGVVVEVGAPPAPSGLDAPRDQVDHLVERLPGQVGVRGGPPHQVEEGVDLPLPGRRHLGHQLLGQDVERCHRRLQHVEVSGPDPGQEGGALDQLVAGQRVEPSGRGALQLVVGPSHPLEEGADGPGRADLADQLDRSDVDAQLEGGGGHQGPQVAGPQPLLDDAATGGRQAAVVGGHLQGGVHPVDVGEACAGGPEAVPVGRRRRSEPQGQLVGDPLGHLAGVDEDQRGAVLEYVGGDAVEDVGELRAAGHRLELAVGSSMATSRSRRWPQSTMVVGGRAGIDAGEERGHHLERALGGRQADALEPHRPARPRAGSAARD